MSDEINRKLLSVVSSLEELVTTMNIFVTRTNSFTNESSPILDSPIWHKIRQELVYIKKYAYNTSSKSDKMSSLLYQINQRLYKLEAKMGEIRTQTSYIKDSVRRIDSDTDRIG